MKRGLTCSDFSSSFKFGELNSCAEIIFFIRVWPFIPLVFRYLSQKYWHKEQPDTFCASGVTNMDWGWMERACFCRKEHWGHAATIEILTQLNSEKSSSQIHSPWMRDIQQFDSGIVLSYLPDSLCSLAVDPMPESTLSPPSGTMNLATGWWARSQRGKRECWYLLYIFSFQRVKWIVAGDGQR